MKKHRIFIIQFTEGELAELLIIIRGEAQKSVFYPDYWNKLAGRVQEQVDEQIKAGDAFQCAACFGLVDRIAKDDDTAPTSEIAIGDGTYRQS